MSRKNIFFLSAICFISLRLTAQNHPVNFERYWKEIDSLATKKGLSQSALTEVDHVYKIAKKEKNDAQAIKALIYKLGLQREYQEDALKKNIQELETEIKTGEEISKSILSSLLAEAYQSYYQQNRYKLFDRTKTVNFIKDDIATWSIDDFRKKISELFINSLKDKSLLAGTKLESFEAIIIKGNLRYMRPTLYDLLAHRALDYFKNDEAYIDEPANTFELSDSAVFADKAVFANYHFLKADSSSLQDKALQLFQELILFHLKDARPDALIDVDLERIQFANQYAVMENKETIYRKALEKVTREYGYQPTAVQASYLLARQYFEKANQYNPAEDTANRYAYLPAKEICEKAIQQKDSSEGKQNCQQLLKQITDLELDMQTEKVNLPGLPFRVLVTYRNFSQVSLRLIKLDGSVKKILGSDYWDDQYWKKLSSLPPFRAFSQLLPETEDFQKHAVEIKIDALPVGEWALIASVDPDFGSEKNPLAVNYFHVSGIAYLNNGLDYFVLNRETGQPLARASVQAWYPYYDSRQERNLEREGESFITDKNGFFSISPPKTNKNDVLKLEFSTTNDHLFMDDLIQTNNYRKEDDNEQSHTKEKFENDNLKTFFFTDRAIYRPGQLVYFKGIVVTKDFDTKKSKILPGFTTKIILYNANEEKLDSLTLTTNEFGSFHGKFLLPGQLLNGEFKIADDSSDNEQSFSVEEYKRPNFYVEYDKTRGTYRLNDSIRISGSAKAFSGNSINGAKGKYHVVRMTRFPYLWSHWLTRMLPAQPKEIAYGDLKTDATGSFHFSFPAVPDNSIGRETEPVFDYKLSTEITDINGETRTAETNISVAYTALQIAIILAKGDNLPVDSFSSILVKTENHSGLFEPASINLSIYKLKSPDHLIRPRYWKQPDQFIMSRAEFIKNFPDDEYMSETKMETWEKTEKIVEEQDTTKEDGMLRFQHRIFQPGWYLIEVTAKDKYGVEVKELKYIQLLESKSLRPANPQYNWALDKDKIAEPGDSTVIDIGSSANNLFVIERVDKEEETILKMPNPGSDYFTFINLNNEKKSTGFRISDKDRGGFGVSYAFIKNNRVFTGETSIKVPWNNKELKINHGTYRDKTLPGSAEQWSINVSGFKKERIYAEVLTGMYDASLDQFKKQVWDQPDLYNDYDYEEKWSSYSNFSAVPSFIRYHTDNSPTPLFYSYDRLLNLNQFQIITLRGIQTLHQKAPLLRKESDMEVEAIPLSKQVLSWAQPVAAAGNEGDRKEKESAISDQQTIQIRKNFNETAFFFPDLRTDSLGDLSFSFTIPEALTAWKWMTLAHTKDLSFGYSERTIITQKQLMVQPNPPRFLREGDHIDFSVKIVNLTDSEMTGQAELQLTDATNNQSVDGWFQNMQANQFFTIPAKQSTVLVFPLQVPFQFNKPVTYRINARAPLKPTVVGEFSDGEEATLPVLSNRLLVTESLPVNMNGKDTKDFKFESLIRSGNSETLNNHSLTVEFTSNPIWTAVQALPYLMDYPYECAEQVFNRFYANSLASAIVIKSPPIREIFKKWEISDTAAFQSNLQKNQELKSVLLQETPWVLEAKNEAQSKKNIALLFNEDALLVKLGAALSKLQDMQSPDGSFAWFKNGPDDRYITQYIMTGIGHLKKLEALPSVLTEKIDGILKAGIAYLDKSIKIDYDNLLKAKSDLNINHLGSLQIQYLYMRSFFSNYDLPGESFTAMNYFRKQSQQFWLQQNKYLQGMIALSLFRTGDIQKAKDILASLRQNAIVNEEMGMYWKDMVAGYYWQQAPVESQSLLIEAFQEIGKDTKTVDELKTWLLKQKQTQYWSTTKSTADACYALLLQGTDWIKEEKIVEFGLGNMTLSTQGSNNEQAGGYFKKTIEAAFINPEMGNIRVTVKPAQGSGQERLSWGAVYWSYFEEMDKLKTSSTALQISKKLFVEKNTAQGLVLEPVAENATLKTGDKLKVRIELKTDRDMEYVHMKDMRASCLEPVNVLSGFKWQGGLGYYESTKDASTNFFFSRLPKGTYIFEYPLFVTNKGSFSNGIAIIQCMYAPEFTAHSESLHLRVEDHE